jgi:hypothetical protein
VVAVGWRLIAEASQSEQMTNYTCLSRKITSSPGQSHKPERYLLPADGSLLSWFAFKATLSTLGTKSPLGSAVMEQTGVRCTASTGRWTATFCVVLYDPRQEA